MSVSVYAHPRGSERGVGEADTRRWDGMEHRRQRKYISVKMNVGVEAWQPCYAPTQIRRTVWERHAQMG